MESDGTGIISGAGGVGTGHSQQTQTQTGSGSGSGSGEVSGGDQPPAVREPPPYSNGDAYEFAAFAAWYIFLLLCCVVPTYCAYRRRSRMARQEMERREAALGRMSGVSGEGNWYAEAMAELERRRREDEVALSAAEGGPNDDVVIFRGTSSDGRLIAVVTGSSMSQSPGSSALAFAEGSSSHNIASSRNHEGRFVYIRDEGYEETDGIRAFASGINTTFGVAGATWFFAAAQQRERIQREERTRILNKILKDSTMSVCAEDLVMSAKDVPADNKEEGRSIGGTEATTIERTNQTTTPFATGGDIDSTGEIISDERDAEERAIASNNDVPTQEDSAIPPASYDTDVDSEYPFLRLRPPAPTTFVDDETDSADAAGQSGDLNSSSESRMVPNSCAICLCPYDVGDSVTWSTAGSDCPHAFHQDCIVLWLCKKDEPLCPCCRQHFVSGDVLIRHLPQSIVEGE